MSFGVGEEGSGLGIVHRGKGFGSQSGGLGMSLRGQVRCFGFEREGQARAMCTEGRGSVVKVGVGPEYERAKYFVSNLRGGSG